MIKIKIASGIEFLIDKEDYEKLPSKTGWYEQKEGLNNARTSYIVHDTYGKIHRCIMGVTDPSEIVDHIDRNGLNNTRANLRVVNNSINKRNQATISTNKFNFNGLSYERGKGNRSGRIKVSYSSNVKTSATKYQQKTKSFGILAYKSNYNNMVRDAVLFRIKMMREFGYNIDERSETIEKECLKDNYNMEQILGINFKDIFE